MQFKTFEEFLQDKHFDLHPAILDDDLSDAYNDWVGNLENYEVMQYAEEAIKHLLK